MTQRMTATPNPSQQGGAFELCYDFAGPPAATSPVTIEVKFDNAPNVDVTLSDTSNCATVNVPKAATGCLCKDGSGQSEEYAVTIRPSEG